MEEEGAGNEEEGAGIRGDTPQLKTGDPSDEDIEGIFLRMGCSSISDASMATEAEFEACDVLAMARMLLNTLMLVFIRLAAQKPLPPSRAKSSKFRGSETAPSEGLRNCSLIDTDCST